MLGLSVGYAVKALSYLVGVGGDPVVIKTIAEETDLPVPYLAKIMHRLALKGIVVSQRGVGGGIRLKRDPSKLSLFDISVALDDAIVNKICMLRTSECSDERACPAHEFWVSHREKQVTFLKAMTLSKVAEFDAKKRRGA